MRCFTRSIGMLVFAIALAAVPSNAHAEEHPSIYPTALTVDHVVVDVGCLAVIAACVADNVAVIAIAAAFQVIAPLSIVETGRDAARSTNGCRDNLTFNDQAEDLRYYAVALPLRSTPTRECKDGRVVRVPPEPWSRSLIRRV